MTENEGTFDQEKLVMRELLIEIWRFLIITDGIKSMFEDDIAYINEDIEEIEEIEEIEKSRNREIENATGVVYEHADLLPDIGHKLTFTSENGWFNKLFPSNNPLQTHEVILQGQSSPDSGKFVSFLIEDFVLDAFITPQIEEQEIVKFYGRMNELLQYSSEEYIKKYSIEVRCSTIANIKECSDSEFKKSIEMLKSNGGLNTLF